MINKEKAGRFFDKAVDFLNESGEKITTFAKEHELDKKIDQATDTIERGASNAYHSVKDAFSSDNNYNNGYNDGYNSGYTTGYNNGMNNNSNSSGRTDGSDGSNNDNFNGFKRCEK